MGRFGNRSCFAGAIMAWSIVTACFVANAPVAWAAKVSTYNPMACKEEAHGKIYIGLGRSVLAIPTSTPVDIRSPLYSGERALPPPDPSDAVGCPGNPLQLSGYALPNANIGILSGEKLASTTDKQLGTQLIQLIRLFPKGDRVWNPEALQLSLVKDACEHPTTRIALYGDLTACLIQPHLGKDGADPVADQRDWGGGYRADTYKTPFGRPFVFNCDPLMYGTSISSCSVVYAFNANFGIIYDFKIYHGPRIIPLDRILDFDQSLRTMLRKIMVNAYPWKTSAGDHS